MYERLYCPEFLNQLHKNYAIQPGRSTNFCQSHLKNIACDFLRGVNLASKRKPLFQQWFWNEPEELVDKDANAKRDSDGKVQEIEVAQED